MIQISRFGYYWLDTWVMANVIQLATQDFCSRFLNRTNDPCGRQYDQIERQLKTHDQARGEEGHQLRQGVLELQRLSGV